METVKKLPTSIRFREDVLGRLKIEASRQHCSVSNYLEMLFFVLGGNILQVAQSLQGEQVIQGY